MIKAITTDTIKSLLLSGESLQVEFKVKVDNAMRMIPRLISAFANTEGGIIIFGYDERMRVVVGTALEEVSIIEKTISENDLDSICNISTIRYKEKTLIIVQVKKSQSIVLAGGGAYKRKSDGSIYVLPSKDVVKQIISTRAISLEDGIDLIYTELRRSEKAHEEQRKEHAKELKQSKKFEVILFVLSIVLGAVLSWGLGKLF